MRSATKRPDLHVHAPHPFSHTNLAPCQAHRAQLRELCILRRALRVQRTVVVGPMACREARILTIVRRGLAYYRTVPSVTRSCNRLSLRPLRRLHIRALYPLPITLHRGSLEQQARLAYSRLAAPTRDKPPYLSMGKSVGSIDAHSLHVSVG